ncbi:MAG: hypothetical protein KHZ06_06330 [Blautia sp.]|uniref:hypothetical protein n=1 Tax=Blautia sp. TaxID=1955243 RepID=UPI00257B8F99|nr:hypothetical protein [Blautia sp.]MBS5122491.1 hypothetical protein [Blautia sp.]
MSIFYFKFFKKFMKENEKGISGTLPGLQRKEKSGGSAGLFVDFSGCDNFCKRLYCNTEKKNKKE